MRALGFKMGGEPTLTHPNARWAQIMKEFKDKIDVQLAPSRLNGL